MRVVLFAHSLVSCWNHGNAHFLRGVVRELTARGHDVRVYEPADGWSRTNLAAEHPAAEDHFAVAFPDLRSETYGAKPELDEMLDGADLVLVHEWTDPAIVAAIGRLHGRHTLLFHDTHHRAVSDPEAMRALDLDGYDGVLAFGQAVAEVYQGWGWGDRVFVWHEAADLALFRLPPVEGLREGLVWIGNWGDGERTAELETFLLAPARDAGLPLDIHGVRFPADATALLARYGGRYHGWVANADAPATFARHLATIHVPRRCYASALPGIPTIRVFEALACGIPLLSAPWDDAEGLFRVGTDFLMARDGNEMSRNLRALTHDPELRESLVAHGLETVRARHGCGHRVEELLRIVAGLKVAA